MKRKRRFWSDEEKRRVVAATRVSGVSVAAVARRYDINANQVFNWLRDARYTYAMTQHLAEISRHVADNAHAVLVMDQAGWHMSANLIVPDNITILPLPPRSPELNPVENIWQFMRDNWLSNRVFKSYDDIVDHCCHAWSNLQDQPWRIMSIGLRKWAHGF